MKNLRIGAKIWLGFSCVFMFLLAIAVTTIISSFRTGDNIDELDIYVGMENSANELIHILNETRITAAVFYETHSPKTYSDIKKQLMYADYRLQALYDYIDANTVYEGLGLAKFRTEIEAFDTLYSQWRTGVLALGTTFNLEEAFSEEETAAFAAQAGEMRRINLLAHEMLSNTIGDIGEVSSKETNETKSFHSIALMIVLIVSAISLIAAIGLSALIIRSITPPIRYMRSILKQIGETGDMQIDGETHSILQTIAQGKDEIAQCTSALLIMVERLRSIDGLLSHVAEGDLTVQVALQSGQDTMGLAVKTMLDNLNVKFGTIAQSTDWVRQKAVELSEGSQLLSDGSQTQAESVEHLSGSVSQIVEQIHQNTALAQQAAHLADSIQADAISGTELMKQMTQAAKDINTASQSIASVIKVIDNIAFQTNILALNAAVEAARAGQHGRGFSVVAEEVRTLATKSAEAARDTGTLIEDTVQKAALGESIAGETSNSLERIVQGVMQSSALISEIATLSGKQSDNVQQIISDVGHVERIVEQNNTIASESAGAAGDISEQSRILNDLVGQFQLSESTQKHSYERLTGRY